MPDRPAGTPFINGGFLENGLPLFNIGGTLKNGLLLFNIEGVDGDFSDGDFTQYINDKEDYAEYTGPMQYIPQHALRNVEGRDISSIHNFPTHQQLRFIASWLNYGKASCANPMDADGDAQHCHEYGEMNITHPTSVHPRIMRCSDYGVTCRTNGETYYSSTTTHTHSASVLLELPNSPTYASYGAWRAISPSIIRAGITQHLLIRLLTQLHDNHRLLIPVAVWGDITIVHVSTVASFWVIHNDDIPTDMKIMRVGHCNKATHLVPRLALLTLAQENQGCSTDGPSNICEADISGGWIDKYRCFSGPNVPCVKNGELPPIGTNAYSLRLVNSPTEFHCNRANSSTLPHIIMSLRVHSLHGLYENMYHTVSFEKGVEPTLIHQRNHAILLWGDYSFASCSISAQDSAVAGINLLHLSTSKLQSDCCKSLWNAYNIFLYDDYTSNISTCRILLAIEDSDSWVYRFDSAICELFGDDNIGFRTSPIIQGLTALIYAVPCYCCSPPTDRISHSYPDRFHPCTSCSGLGENGSQRDFFQKHLQGYGQLQVSTALQLAVDTSSVYIHDTPSFDVQSTYKHVTMSTTDFIHRFVMRYFDRVSCNDGGDTLLLDVSVLVDMMDTTYLMENSGVIHDDEYVLMSASTSGINGEPHTLVDMTSSAISEWINENVFKSISIWGAWLSDVVGQGWKIIASIAVIDGEIVEDLLSSSGDSSVYGEESRDVDGSSNIALGCNQSNDVVAYFSNIKDEHHGVVDLRSSDPVWHVEADGIQSLFGLELRRAMGRLTLKKINGDACCLKWLDFVEELQEQYEEIQCSIKSTVETGSNNYGDLRECGRTREAIEQLESDENCTQRSGNLEKYIYNNKQWSLEWRTAEKSSLPVLNIESTSAATVDTSPITLHRYLHRFPTQLYLFGMFFLGNYNDYNDYNEISYHLSSLLCVYAWTTRFEKCDLATTKNVNFVRDNISSTGNHASVHLHRTFLSRGASLPNLPATSNTCVILPDLTRCGTIAMNDDKSHAIGIAYWGDGGTSSHDTCGQDTTWGAVDKSSSAVSNTSAAPTAMFCLFSTLFVTTSILRLHRVPIIDFFDGEATSQVSNSDHLYVGTTLETVEPVSVSCIERSSCTSPVNGERFMCRLDKTIHAYSIQDNDASSGNYSLLDGYWNHKQLVNRRRICADNAASASMQQLMGSTSCLSRCRSVIMSTILAKLRALHLVFDAAELEPHAFAVRSVTIYGVGYCCGDVQHDWWKCLCASLGLLVGLLLLLRRRAMGSHTLQIVDSKAGHDTFVNPCHGKLSRMYVSDVLHPFFSKTPVGCIARKRAALGKRWIRWIIRPNLAIRIVLEEGYCKVNIQKDPIQSTNTTNRRGVTEWVRVPVDTDSMSTINTGTFRGIGTRSPSITDRNDNEDYIPNFRKLKSK